MGYDLKAIVDKKNGSISLRVPKKAAKKQGDFELLGLRTGDLVSVNDLKVFRTK